MDRFSTKIERTVKRLRAGRALALTLLCVLIGSWSSVVSAESALVIEEIVVTAQKRESNLQETPIAITAVTRDQIELNRIQTVTDLALRTPSMTYNEQQGHAHTSIRGVGTNLNSLAQEAAVVMYQDGIYRGASVSATVPQFDLERIEVLRGPQGTLYGRNSTGGAINVITRLPSDEAEFNATFTAGNYGKLRGELGVSGPLGERVGGRISFVNEASDGYVDNKTLGRNEADRDYTGVNGSLVFDLSDSTELILRGSYLDDKRNVGQPIGVQLSPTAAGITPENLGGVLTIPDPTLGGLSLADIFGLDIPQASAPFVVDPDSLDYFTDTPMKREIEQYGFSATLTHDFDGITAKLSLAHQDTDYVDFNDSDGLDITALLADGGQTNRQNTVELNLSGDYANDSGTWILGGFYFQEDGTSFLWAELPALQTTLEALFGLAAIGMPLPSGSLAAAPFGQAQLKDGQFSAAPFVNFRGEQDSSSYAVFGQTTYDATDRLHLTLGGRYTKDNKDVHRETRQNIGGPACDQHVEEDWSEVTGTAIVSYDISDDVMTYGSIAKGFKSGGFNIAECGGAFDPETILAYEIGLKSTLFEQRLRFNLAAFYYSWDDIQINRFVNSAITVTNAAEANAFGLEIEFVALLGGGFTVDGGITYLDTEYAGGSMFANPILGGPQINVDGNDLERAPPLKAYLGAQFDWQTEVGRITLRADASYSDRHYFDVFEASLPNQEEMEQDAYTITNAHLRWESNAGKYAATLFVQNIGNKLYAQTRAALGTLGGIYAAYSPPRQYGITLKMQLGGT